MNAYSYYDCIATYLYLILICFYSYFYICYNWYIKDHEHSAMPFTYTHENKKLNVNGWQYNQPQ
jgi:hypothetical protein